MKRYSYILICSGCVLIAIQNVLLRRDVVGWKHTAENALHVAEEAAAVATAWEKFANEPTTSWMTTNSAIGITNVIVDSSTNDTTYTFRFGQHFTNNAQSLSNHLHHQTQGTKQQTN